MAPNLGRLPVKLRSHHGCQPCRRRKIKCDETHPVCKSCRRLGDACLYQPRPAPSESRTDRPAYGIADELKAVQAVQSAQAMPLPPLSPMTLLAVRLMHHYTAHTALTLHTDLAKTRLFQLEIPQLAMQHPFLLDAVFAVTCMHLAFEDAHQRDFYQDRAAMFFLRALSDANTKLLDQLHASSEAAVSFGSFVAWYQCALMAAAARDDPAAFDIVQHQVRLMGLTRGISSMIRATEQTLRGGCFGVLLQQLRPSDQPLDDLAFANTSQLYQMAQADDSGAVHDPYTVDGVMGTLLQAHACVAADSAAAEPANALAWIVAAPSAYLDMLGAAAQDGTGTRTPWALAALAHQLMLLHRYRDRWWIGCAPQAGVRRVYALLGPGWRPNVAWPLQAVDGFGPRLASEILIRVPRTILDAKQRYI